MKTLLISLMTTMSISFSAIAVEPQSISTQAGRLTPSARFEVVPEMQVYRLGNFRGQFLHVLYVISYNPFIATTVEQTIVKEIRLAAKPIKLDSDFVNLPSVSIEKSGISGAYNNILFVISKDENFSWKNSDLSLIENYKDTGANQKSLVKSVKITQIEAFLKSGMPTPMQISILD